MAAGLVLMAAIGRHAGNADIVWRMALCGIGFGLFQSPNNRTMLTTAPRARSGAAGGTLATARLVGLTMGTAAVALIFGLVRTNAEAVELSVAAVLAVLAGLASVARRTRTAAPAG